MLSVVLRSPFFAKNFAISETFKHYRNGKALQFGARWFQLCAIERKNSSEIETYERDVICKCLLEVPKNRESRL